MGMTYGQTAMQMRGCAYSAAASWTEMLYTVGQPYFVEYGA